MIKATRESRADLWNPGGSGSGGREIAEWGDANDDDDLARLDLAARDVHEHLRQTALWQVESLEEKFARHAAKWHAETGFMSSVRDKALHRSYQRIIGMGQKAVPLILRDLRKSPDHWFWALHAITGVDPVPPSDRGRIRRMTDAWLRWGRAQGFLTSE